MNFKNLEISKSLFCLLLMCAVSLFSSCGDDNPDILQSTSFSYSFHNGQVVSSAPYLGTHSSDLTATLKLDELENGNTNITVSIDNTLEGQTYHTHAHDAADASSTPNGTPYSESPNSSIFAQAIMGNGGTATISQEATMSYDELVSDYAGFFVIHDPLQTVNTADISTYLVVGGFAREQSSVNYSSSSFQYDFNTGQVAAAFAYDGMHPTNLGATITVSELAENKSRVTIEITNTIAEETYHTHAHDMADAAMTPNGTPYNETPNTDVFASPIIGNGGTAAVAVISPISYTEITSGYEGFFVIHDPLQALTTVDPTTYVVLASFAR